MLDEDFFEYLQAQLSLALGPIAEVLIEDALNDLGHQHTQFPSTVQQNWLICCSRNPAGRKNGPVQTGHGEQD